MKKLVWILLAAVLSACETSTPVENADLTSIGNIGRYKREQTEREQHMQDLQAQTAKTQNVLAHRRVEEARLEHDYDTLKEQVARQTKRLQSLEASIDAARAQRRITEQQRSALLRRIQQTRHRIVQYGDIDQPTANEIAQGHSAVKEAEPVIAGLENLSRSGFKDVSPFVNAL